MSRILVVDDHAVVREPLARLLRLEGYRTTCAGNGIEAIAAMETEPADLILLDLMLPRKDGIAFMEWLRAEPRWRDRPVIVLTAVIEGSLLDRARDLCGGDVLYKSRFTVEELFARIRSRLAAGIV
jgi:two-component system response regulator MprA